MLKQYHCIACNDLQVKEEETVDIFPLCGRVYIEGSEPACCIGKMVQFKSSEFPANSEIINMISELTTKLAFVSLEIQNLTAQKEAVESQLKKCTVQIDEMYKDKIVIENNRRELKLKVDASAGVETHLTDQLGERNDEVRVRNIRIEELEIRIEAMKKNKDKEVSIIKEP